MAHDIETIIATVYGDNPTLLAEDVAVADTLAEDMDDAFAVRHFAERLNVPFDELFDWCEHDGYYCIGAVIGVAAQDDAAIIALREYFPPQIQGYLLTEEEMLNANALIEHEVDTIGEYAWEDYPQL